MQEYTDKERLDFLQYAMKGYGKGWILRDSDNKKGLRLHETSQDGAVPDVRTAIDIFIKKEYDEFRRQEQIYNQGI